MPGEGGKWLSSGVVLKQYLLDVRVGKCQVLRLRAGQCRGLIYRVNNFACRLGENCPLSDFACDPMLPSLPPLPALCPPPTTFLISLGNFLLNICTNIQGAALRHPCSDIYITPLWERRGESDSLCVGQLVKPSQTKLYFQPWQKSRGLLSWTSKKNSIPMREHCTYKTQRQGG